MGANTNGRKGEMKNWENMSTEIEEDANGRYGGVKNRVLVEKDGVGVGVGVGGELDKNRPYHLDKFTLFETPSNFYIIGRDKERLRWRVLKIGRSEPSELVIFEDPTTYSYPQCKLLLEDINEVNKLSGGRKFVTDCYGIVGFVKFLGPYYILLVTKRKEIGKIDGHPIYAVSEYKMIPVPHSTVLSCMNISERENRYKKLLYLVDIRKDFFFSYTYPIMHRLQNNMSQKNLGQSYDGNMFVWNDYLTNHVRNQLKNTLWTVALVHGFFKQVELSAGGKKFLLTLIARRSIQFAGVRYQKRGVNEEGDAANDVEIEQIVSQLSQSDNPQKITSVVQNRGSIPMPWSQRASLWNYKPEVLFPEGNEGYEATHRHIQKLCLRYGKRIILLNLIKSGAKYRRESLIGQEFSKAVDCVNTDLDKEHHLELLNLDLNAAFRKEGADVLNTLKDNVVTALTQIGYFSCQIPESASFKASSDMYPLIDADCGFPNNSMCNDENINTVQEGILRTNCLDSLDRTNVAQYVYSIVALGQQLHALGLTESPDLEFNTNLAYELMSLFEALGDSLAKQYGGSAAHRKIFSKIKGQCKASIVFEELIKSVQRHISNSFFDVDKQQAIDLFLGHFRPDSVQSTPLQSNVVRRESLIGHEFSEAVDFVNTDLDEEHHLNNLDLNAAFLSELKISQSDSEVPNEGSSTFGGRSDISTTDSELSCPRHAPHVSSARMYGSHHDDADKVETMKDQLRQLYEELLIVDASENHRTGLAES